MKFFRILTIILLSLIGLFIIISLFLPDKVHVERSIEIKANASVPFELVNVLNHWEAWDPWMKLDSNQVRTYVGSGSGKGTSYKWTSKMKEVGSGSVTIIESIPKSLIKTELVFEGQGKAISTFKFEEKGGTTKVTWSFDSDLDFMSRMFGLMFDSWLGKDFEKGLANIKKLSESAPPSTIQIELVDVPAKKILFIRDSCGMSEIGPSLGKAYGEIMTFINKNGLSCTEPPLAITNGWDKNSWNFDAACVISQARVKPVGRIQLGESYSGKAVKGIYFGPYDKVEPAYNEIMKFIENHGYKISGRSWEAYMNDPQNTPPDKLQTDIYFPVEKK